MQQFRVKWYKSLTFLGLLGLTLVPLWDLAGISLIMSTEGRDLVVAESSRLIEQLGNNAIHEINIRSRQVGALTGSLARAAEQMPHQVPLFERVLPAMLDFGGDQDIAGGGIWPEPFAFDPGREKRSFFYGRGDDGAFSYFDDYNHGRGYHHDEWYPVVRYSAPNECFWSKSYMDPYSFQPMVTCTIAMREGGRFWGVATVDLKLEGLHDFMNRIREKTGGYVFLMDRNNTFLTFPQPELVRHVETDEAGNRTEHFVTAADFAVDEPRFAPIAQSLADMNQAILDRAQEMHNYNPALADLIDEDSDQISHEEAEFIAAVIADPLAEQTRTSYLYEKFLIEDDWLTNEESLVFLFHVPGSYWKLVAVKPMSEAGAVASSINRVLLTMIVGTILIGVLIAAVLMHYFFTRPIRQTTAGVRSVGELVHQKAFDRLSEYKLKIPGENEMGELASVINSLAGELQSSYVSLVELNANLEQKVADRTKDLEQSLKEIRELKFQQDGDYFLTSLLTRPFNQNKAESDFVSVDFLLKQKKEFSFRKWSSSIGGDMCSAHSIQLNDRPFTVFLNADAMGKSIQGAGGVLVLGSIFEANVKRTRLSRQIQTQSPERWIRNAFAEIQGVFESFDGSMLISCFLAIIDDEAATMYYINAEHPRTVLLRAGHARFLDEENPIRKVGIEFGAIVVAVQVLRLLPGDVILTGSDGRDDVLLGKDAAGTRIINEDETLFLKAVSENDGRLEDILAQVTERGELTDDLSLIRVAYRHNDQEPTRRFDTDVLRLARDAAEQGNLEEAARLLEGAYENRPDDRGVAKNLVRLYVRLSRFEAAAPIARKYAVDYPWDTDFLQTGAIALHGAGDFERAIEMAERLRARQPGAIRNLQLLEQLHTEAGNTDRASSIARELVERQKSS